MKHDGDKINPGKGNFVKKTVLIVMAATVTAAGTVLAFAPTASAQDCPAGVEAASQQYNTEGLAGNLECHDDGSLATGTITSWPAVGTGGLILRDEQGNDLGSGIGEGQTFEFLECGPPGSGLILVSQITRGEGGGWGDLYSGYVKARWTMVPSQFDLCE
jgi:hypothetical protein